MRAHEIYYTTTTGIYFAGCIMPIAHTKENTRNFHKFLINQQ